MISMSSLFADFVSCTASRNQGSYSCQEAFDGSVQNSGNGWAYDGQVPAWASFKLAEETKITSLRLVSGIDRNDHRLITFKVSMHVNNRWVVPGDLRVKEDSEAIIANDGTITLSTGIHVASLSFNPISNVKSVRIDVTKTDAANNNLVLTEIIPNFADALPLSKYFQVP
jgi:hypothetical protein